MFVLGTIVLKKKILFFKLSKFSFIIFKNNRFQKRSFRLQIFSLVGMKHFITGLITISVNFLLKVGVLQLVF